MRTIKATVVCLLLLMVLPTAAIADIVSSSATHYVLRHESRTQLSVEALWERLIRPASWWHPDHTYSGDAANLSLALEPGGLWQETWEGGAVAHGEVLLVIDGSTLRLNAPFGPLQGAGAYAIWTITVAEDEEGTIARFEETATGPESAALHELAPAVDFVKSEAIRRLTAN